MECVFECVEVPPYIKPRGYKVDYISLCAWNKNKNLEILKILRTFVSVWTSKDSHPRI